MLGAFACCFVVLMTLLLAMFCFRMLHLLASKVKKHIKLNGFRKIR